MNTVNDVHEMNEKRYNQEVEILDERKRSLKKEILENINPKIGNLLFEDYKNLNDLRVSVENNRRTEELSVENLEVEIARLEIDEKRKINEISLNTQHNMHVFLAGNIKNFTSYFSLFVAGGLGALATFLGSYSQKNNQIADETTNIIMTLIGNFGIAFGFILIVWILICIESYLGFMSHKARHSEINELNIYKVTAKKFDKARIIFEVLAGFFLIGTVFYVLYSGYSAYQTISPFYQKQNQTKQNSLFLSSPRVGT